MTPRPLVALCGFTLLACAETPQAPPPLRVHVGSPVEAPDLAPEAGVARFQLTIAPHRHEVGGVVRDGFAYNGQFPGPTLRATKGDHVEVSVRNTLATETTVHWHGLAVPNDMDGVSGPPIAPGSTRTYRFSVERSGTFWYHPHLHEAEQIDAGLYGTFVVEEPREPLADVELIAVLDAWNETLTPEEPHVASEIDLTPSLWLVNGAIEPTYLVAAGSRVRVRLLNASNVGYVALARATPAEPVSSKADEGHAHVPAPSVGSPLRLIASDQGLLPAAVDIPELVLAPGDRAELEVLVGSDTIVLVRRPYTAAGGPTPSPAQTLFTVTPVGSANTPPALPWPFEGARPTANVASTVAVFALSGSTHGAQWLINGATFPDVPPVVVPLGQVAVLEVRNVSGVHHPFHLHGMTFEVLRRNGVAPTWQTIEDTLDLPPREATHLLIRPTHPGDWLAHCHILPHVEGGMTAVLHVPPP